VGKRIDFSANAAIYDRRHGTLLAHEVVQELAYWGDLRPGARILEVGAGTGRVSIAFAGIGCKILAVDPAVAMLDQLRRKAPEAQIHILVGEGARLPFATGCFDGVVLARVLYLMSDWQSALRQAYEVLKPTGCLLHEWGNGQADEAWVQVREKARTLFEEAGVNDPFHPGARSEAEVDAFLMRLGLIQSKRLPAGHGAGMTLGDFVRRMVNGELSYIWNVPKHVQQACLPQLEEWCRSTFDLEQIVPIPRELVWTIYRKT
jgi:SAM-dependent methyltransferase